MLCWRLADVNECTSTVLSDTCACTDSGIPPCEPVCTNAVGSFVCSCSVGYEIDSLLLNCFGQYCTPIADHPYVYTVLRINGCSQDKWMIECCLFLDIDECTTGAHVCTCDNLAGCSPVCLDTVGSYTCDCSAGFTISGDGITCLGEYHCYHRYWYQMSVAMASHVLVSTTVTIVTVICLDIFAKSNFASLLCELLV